MQHKTNTIIVRDARIMFQIHIIIITATSLTPKFVTIQPRVCAQKPDCMYNYKGHLCIIAIFVYPIVLSLFVPTERCVLC